MAKLESIQAWREAGIKMEWTMPKMPWIYRLPIIRHAITQIAFWQVEWHYTKYAGFSRSGYDEWVLLGMWYGLTTADIPPGAAAEPPTSDADALDEARMLTRVYLLAADEELTTAAQALKRRIARAIVTAANDDRCCPNCDRELVIAHPLFRAGSVSVGPTDDGSVPVER